MAFFSFFKECTLLGLPITFKRAPEYDEGKEGHLEQKRAKEDSDKLEVCEYLLGASL